MRLVAALLATALGWTGARAPESGATIVALGDSTTAGTPAFRSPIEAPPNGAGNPESQYAYWLMKMHPGWRVLNRGVNGERSDEVARRFDRDVLAAHPDAVVIVAGVNDVYQGLPADVVVTALRGMYDRAEGAGILVVAGTIIPYDTATADQNARMHQINAWIVAESRRDAKLHVVDTRAAVAPPDHPDRLAASPDGLHPDVAGYRRMAEAIGPVLQRFIR